MGTKNERIFLNTTEETYYYRKSWLQLIRPMTLTGIISPTLVGTGFALTDGPIQLDLFFAVLITALLIQSATNVLNDYFDFKYGQDNEKWTKQADTASPIGPAHHLLPYFAGLLLIIAIGIGIWLAISSSLWIIAVGVIGIFAGIKYSAGKRSFCSIGMGELIAAIFLGPVITLLAYFVQLQTLNLEILFISLLFALLISSMILTNNIRDYKKDKDFRRTLAHRLGRKNAIYLLIVLLFSVYVMLILFNIFHVLPITTLLSFLALPVAIRLLWAFRKNRSRKDEVSGMKWAALHHWAFGLLLSISLWLF